MGVSSPGDRLNKELGLFDVYAICTGAMFSSGFFLLPGLAAAQTGPSVFVAYLIAGILMLPAMFSMAELATAMPRAGGDYFCLDRALGPAFGTVGGIGTFLGLTLKSAFALVGMGAYLKLFLDVPIKTTAIILTVLFVWINIVGAKETSRLQRVLVTVLVAVMGFYLVQGLIVILSGDGVEGGMVARLTPFLRDVEGGESGIGNLLGAVGFVVVSYAGLTKIASVAEEIKNPGRNIPLGMMLSIISTSIIYVVGIFIMVMVLPPDELRGDLTPVASAGERVMLWIPPTLGVILIVAAATAAFASTGNAGILAASRYPLAMGRDKLLPPAFARLGRHHTPFVSILVTGGVMIAAILLLNEAGIAKLASAFELLVFLLINVTVIVMRESRIASYDPPFRSPFYPYMQIGGILASALLIAYLGHLAMGMTIGVASMALIWYYKYAHHQVVRQGAVFHWFEQLGRRRYDGVELELEDILREQELRKGDPLDEIIEQAPFIDIVEPCELEQISQLAVEALNECCQLDIEQHTELFMQEFESKYRLVTDGVALPHLRLDGLNRSRLVFVRYQPGYPLDINRDGTIDDDERVYAFFFLVSPLEKPGPHLRMLAHLARQINDPGFLAEWRQAANEQEIREIMLHSERMLVLWVSESGRTADLNGKYLRDLKLPSGSLVAIISRHDQKLVPSGQTVLQSHDRLTIIGEPASIEILYRRYVSALSDRLPSTAPNDANEKRCEGGE